jgi:hypothetical protein
LDDKEPQKIPVGEIDADDDGSTIDVPPAEI